MMKVKQRKMSDPATWAIDPTRMIPDLTRPTTAVRHDGQDLIPTASIAASVSAPAATGGDVTVTMPARRPPIAAESNPRDTSTSTKRHTAASHCEQCGDEFTPRRPHGRFCSSYCRRLAWLDRNPDRAAALAESDRQRLREHVIGCGGEWRD